MSYRRVIVFSSRSSSIVFNRVLIAVEIVSNAESVQTGSFLAEYCSSTVIIHLHVTWQQSPCVCVCVCVWVSVYISIWTQVDTCLQYFQHFQHFHHFHHFTFHYLLHFWKISLVHQFPLVQKQTNKTKQNRKKKRQTCVRWFSSIQISKRQCCNIGFIYTWLIRRHTLVYIFFIRFSSSWSYRSDLLLCAGMDWIDGIDFGNTNEIRPAQWVALVESQPEHWHHNDMNPAQQMATKTPSPSHPPI